MRLQARAVRLAPNAGALIIQYGELYRRLASLPMGDSRSDGPRPDHNLHVTDRLRLAVGNRLSAVASIRCSGPRPYPKLLTIGTGQVCPGIAR
jgi:hypothetical protein